MNTIHSSSSIDNRFIENNKNNVQNNLNAIDLQKNFLSLLMAQIKNQDPTDPIKNSELTSQLAQINTATGIEKLNNTAQNISHQINTSQNIQGSSLIGHHVMIPNNHIVYTEGSDTGFGIELIKPATIVNIEIKDEKGNVVYSKKMRNIKPGIYNLIWNGKYENKKSVSTGKYNIFVTAKNNDQNVPVQSLSKALVHSIITSSEDPIIDLAEEGKIMLSQIREIL